MSVNKVRIDKRKTCSVLSLLDLWALEMGGNREEVSKSGLRIILNVFFLRDSLFIHKKVY